MPDTTETNLNATPEVISHDSLPNLAVPNPELLQQPVFPTPAAEDNQPDKDPLPSNYMECFAIQNRLKEILRISRNAYQQADLQARIKKVGEHIVLLQNGPRQKPFDYTAAARERGAAIVVSESNRNDEIDRHLAAITKDEWLPVFPEKDVPDLLIDFMASDDFLPIAISLRRAQAFFNLQLHKAFFWLNPGMRRSEHKVALSSHPSDEVIKQVTDEIAQMGSDPRKLTEHFKLIASHKAASLNTLHRTTVRPLVELLLNSGLLFFTEQKLSAIAAEADFCEAHSNVPWQATNASKRYDAVIADLQHHLNEVRGVHANGKEKQAPVIGNRVHGPETVLQTMFGVPVLPPAIDEAAA